MRRLGKVRFRFLKEQSGISLIETLLAVVILGLIAVPFISAVTTSSKAAFAVDQRTTAESLAQSQMEWIKSVTYVEDATDYPPAPMPSDSDYANYSVVITAAPLRDPDDGMQKITVTIKHSDKTIIRLESYKRQK